MTQNVEAPAEYSARLMGAWINMVREEYEAAAQTPEELEAARAAVAALAQLHLG